MLLYPLIFADFSFDYAYLGQIARKHHILAL